MDQSITLVLATLFWARDPRTITLGTLNREYVVGLQVNPKTIVGIQ